MRSIEGIESGSKLGKYRVLERSGKNERSLFRAVATESEKTVCLLQLSAEEVPAFAPAKRLQHAHLARVLEILEHEDSLFLVFEDVPGMTLTARLLEIGQKNTVDAVGSALRVSDALGALHGAGSVHGFLHTDSVVLDPPERLGPVLSFAPIPSDERTFHSPERGETGKPSVADDAWAAAGLLHMMLTGKPPPKDGYRTSEELARAGVRDPALCEALLHGLNSDVEKRNRDIRPLRRELARWFVEHAGEERASTGPLSSVSSSTQPPPLPAELLTSQSPAHVTAARSPAVITSRRPRFMLLAAGGTLVGLVGAWALSAWLARPKVTLIERPIESAAVPAPRPIDLSEVPVTGEEQTVELDQTASCVAGYLPKGAFAKSPDLKWLCEERDAKKGAQKLRVAIVSAAPKADGPTDAMKMFSRIGWYDVAVHAVVRAGCCTEAQPVTLPDPGPGCDPMADALRELGREAVAGKNYEEPLKRYTASIHCEFNLGRSSNFGHTARPQPGEEAAFRELVQSVAH